MESEKRIPLLSVRNITKVYPGGIVANKNVSLDIFPGEVLALLGENGAGKTTLVSIIAGLLQPTSGDIMYNGQKVRLSDPRAAMRLGIVLIPQNPMLIENFSVVESLVLIARLAGMKVGARNVRELVKKIEASYGLQVNTEARIWSLSFGERQRVEIIKALVLNAKVILLDEPTTHLSPIEAENLIKLVRRLAEEDRAVVFITHRIHEALKVADRIAVMRQGELVGVLKREEADTSKILSLMFGERIKKVAEYMKERRNLLGRSIGRKVLELNDVWVRGPHGEYSVRGVSFSVREGEIVGIAGVAGNGQRELFETLIGLRRPEKGVIMLCKHEVSAANPFMRGKLGAAIIPEERLGWAVVPGKSLVFNTVLGLYSTSKAPFRFNMVVDWGMARRITSKIIREMKVKTPGINARVDELSGGNMQRYIVGRELYKEPCTIIASNPTSGLDVEAAESIRTLLMREASRGAGVLVISEDLDELVEISDKILVMNRGRIVYEASRPFDMKKIAEAMTVS
ncbi:ABC transporter ATP-binding protein [Pyrofollis japonicus]|uniref:ABC transporter ATP-binding protein n=1 Tax=Pyrofollis japonicus TaxID=3060460 RepID=UPI00295B66E0|nr:ABC transporter ATP-binding protein [Pyrofollis japonicus]BEP18244.1 ABC transporter ATP-binding protein [Pyrofollis japonicus]